MKTIDLSNYEFNNQKVKVVNGIEMNQEYPKTFHIPSKEAKELLKKSVEEGKEMYVKIAVVVNKGERFWCKVISIDSNKITGSINNDLVLTNEHGLADNDQIVFEFDNILDIIE